MMEPIKITEIGKNVNVCQGGVNFGDEKLNFVNNFLIQRSE